MDLKKRLMFSNAAIIIVPVAVTFSISFIVIFISAKLFNLDISFGNFKKMADIQYEFFLADGSTLGTSPDLIFDVEFQKYISSRLKSINADIIVLKGQERVFSTINLSIIDVEKCLDKGKSQFFSGSIKLDAGTFIVRVIPVFFKDGEKGNVILLSQTGREWPTSENLLIIVAAIFIISFLLTNIAIVFGFSRRIIKPLEKLQEAAGKISTGSLDFEVIEDGDYEIRQLCKTFEQMRLKLLEGEHNRIKYDASRKMLLSSISHDLKTPITSIKGYVEGILDGVAATPEKMEKYLKTIYSKTVHIDMMIDDLFLYSKLDLNQVPFELEKIDIVSFFEYCIYEIEPELEKENIRISIINELSAFRYVNVDREKFRRVVLNIIGNSRKYMDKTPGIIDILLRETTSCIIIEIRDNGAGISQKDLPHIFDRFYRADSAREVMSGSGLGLAIAKQIIEGMEGKIWARSNIGEGTSILISLKKFENGGNL